ncbi:peptidase U32 family protein [Pseudomonas proteolytica]|uniref:Collagenase-like protease n=1 Tax=Pseudomonas proteolytica TaxID=219574 RepID=A0AAW5AJW8_9PSED|nr:U32 family peptidase [Pseudomonas proteolytica]KAA8704059.1 U32 family peptidase [Pseudomonas proteolytica]MCF5061090.1 collagenase-like protease [Pseudomonas proteolytica]MCF5104482.1 collagenase-like protease [Pseudomonas proteolytica]TWR79697.1 U32 family peptidase [Pseudomonas proteolytica]SEE33131.1 putative protease [Pseudomonas proteolytica]
MSLPKHHLELLSPARDVSIAREAILHGADAVYIGGPSFGARHNACNDVSEIAQLVEFARRYHARVFTTINTILHDDELEPARKLIHQLHDAGVDALIVQDLGVMELDIPPIELHASTQTDIRTLARAKFLDQAGFSQLVLARELNLQEIRAIADETDAAIEFFIHGALCVAFSGQCNISHAQNGRSANRGDCSQACRLPYTLKDDQGRVVAFEKHLLSMKDNNQSANLRALVEAGVRSFKIEGRYKDMGYVKNITAYYRQRLDEILEDRPDLARASSGRTAHFFLPDPEKTFHRGSTDYFVSDRKIDIGAFDTPTFTGLPVGVVEKAGKRDLQVITHEQLSNGDGLNVLIKREVVGFRANIAEPKGEFEEDGEKRYRYRVEPNEMPAGLHQLRPNHPLNRNLDHNWQQALLKTSAERRIGVSWQVCLREDQLQLTATSEEGVSASTTLPGPFGVANKPEQALDTLRDLLGQLGTTQYHATAIELDAPQAYFIPNSQLKALRRDVIEALTVARVEAHPRGGRKAETTPPPVYPESHLSFLANVYNQKARDFYHRHGVKLIDAAYEAHEETGEVPVMITKHCLRFSFNLCPKQAKGVTGVRTKVAPMQLIHGDEVLTLKFDCKPCEMHVVGKIKGHILDLPLPGSGVQQQVVGHISPADLLKTIPRAPH